METPTILPAYAVLSIRQLRAALRHARKASKDLYDGRIVDQSTICLRLEVDTSDKYRSTRGEVQASGFRIDGSHLV